MKKLFALILLVLLAVSLPAQVKIGGTNVRGGTSTTGVGSGGGGGSFCSGSEVFCDDFDDNNLTGWTDDAFLTFDSFSPDTAVITSATSQELQIQPVTDAGTKANGLYNTTGLHFTDRNASVKAIQPQVATSGFNNTGHFAVVKDTNNYFRTRIESGQICFNGVQATASTPAEECTAWSATNHLYWRIRFDTTNSKVYFEVSADRTSWSELGTPGGYTLTADMSTTDWHVEFLVGTFAAHGSVQLTRWDDVKVVAN